VRESREQDPGVAGTLAHLVVHCLQRPGVTDAEGHHQDAGGEQFVGCPLACRRAISRISPSSQVERMQVAHGGGRDEQDELGLGVLGFQVLRPLDRLRAGCGLVGDDELAAIALSSRLATIHSTSAGSTPAADDATLWAPSPTEAALEGRRWAA
jgi:hypothetical protein